MKNNRLKSLRVKSRRRLVEKKPLKKRKVSTLVDYESSAESSKEEDGEIIEQHIEAETSDDTTSSSGSDTDMSD